MIIKKVFPWLLLWSLLLIFFQFYYEFHFYYIEQNHLFLYNSTVVCGLLKQPGGLATLITEFLIQFYALPYMGAMISSILTLLGGGLVWLILCKLLSNTKAYVIPVLFIILLIFLQVDFNYYLQGTIAFILVAFLFFLFTQLRTLNKRFLYVLILSPLLYWAVGAGAIIFVILSFLYETLYDKTKGLYFIIPLLIVVATACITVWMGYTGEYKYAFLSDAYYNVHATPSALVYMPWWCLVLMIVIAYFLSKRKKKTIWNKKKLTMSSLIQIVLAILLFAYCLPRYGDLESTHYKKIDYYTRVKQWDKIIEISEGPLNNYVSLCYLNMALAQKNELGDRIFFYDQSGSNGLLIPWNKTLPSAILLSETYYTLGNIPAAQHLAFEGNVIANNQSHRLLRRLIETNIISGAYVVAEKYINILEQTLLYKEWANYYRALLSDDAVAKDEELSLKRLSLLSENYLYQTATFEEELGKLAENNPLNHVPIQYLGASYLLNKNLEGYRLMLEKYYRTPILPRLPLSFQEAVLLAYEQNPEVWMSYNISPQMAQRFNNFKNDMLNYQNNPNIATLMSSYNNTYWYYFLFK